jgi:hypothetical protein
MTLKEWLDRIEAGESVPQILEISGNFWHPLGILPPPSPEVIENKEQTRQEQETLETMLPASFRKEYKKILGPLSKESEDGLNTLLREIEGDQNFTEPAEIAYVLATVWHETWQAKRNIRFQPCIEYYGGSKQDEYFEERYGCDTKKGKELGNTEKGDGARYRGRGYVMITGKDNYRRISKRMGDGDFLISPNCSSYAAVNPYAYKILSIGMREGLFTGKKLSDYREKGGGYDFVKARAIVNGRDKAELIAGHARQIYSILVKRESEAA